MKLSELEITAYDLAAIIIPGLIAEAEIFVGFVGFRGAVEQTSHLTVTLLAILILCAFALGQIVSQAANEFAILFAGKRFFFKERDAYWKVNNIEICKRLKDARGVVIDPNREGSCDRAYDQCLTIIGSAFEKRKVFTLVSSLSLSLWFLSITALLPSGLSLFHSHRGLSMSCVLGTATVAIFSTSAFLMWRRLILFGKLADITTFHIFEVLEKSPAETAAFDTKEKGLTFEIDAKESD